MTGNLKESLDALKKRVERLEKSTITSPMFKWTGLAVIAAGMLSLVIGVFNPVLPTWQTWALILFGTLLLACGGVVLAAKFLSSHAEGVEADERQLKISERSGSARCIYLEGNVPDGKGIVGRCRLYEFDMIEYPYCLYCKEYKAQSGNPDL